MKKNKKIDIIGCGFIGTNFAQICKDNNIQVVNIDEAKKKDMSFKGGYEAKLTAPMLFETEKYVPVKTGQENRRERRKQRFKR